MISKGDITFKKKELLEDVLEDGDVDAIKIEDMAAANITEVDEQLQSLATLFKRVKNERLQTAGAPNQTESPGPG